ncbi:TAP42-domain-containing protein [Ceraceosorus guamensis]|uniref:TAP42-domain-containing protein n=1 Tax=Ceraceosorus guamensis TaxID=1522189 RepID=A0A316VTQ6_9BASI|nr:TAP42-domain-containing protein [Ceraceosorus guamensis]PWN40584.1 TAP42-domain-containing protein [Ceraceosorus guamensis]
MSAPTSGFALPNHDLSSLSLTGRLQRIFQQAAHPSPSLPPVSDDPSTSSATPTDPALALLQEIKSAQELAASLDLVSHNDHLEDLSTATLRALLLPAVLAEVLTRVKTPIGPPGISQRLEVLKGSAGAHKRFLKSLLRIGVLPSAPSSERSAAISSDLLLLSRQAQLHTSTSPSTSLVSQPAFPSPGSKRDLKIALFKLERAIVNALDQFRVAARQRAHSQASGIKVPDMGFDSATASHEAPAEALWDLLLLSKPNVSRQESEDEDAQGQDDDGAEDDALVQYLHRRRGAASSTSSPTPPLITRPSSLRGYTLLLLLLHACKTISALDSVSQEVSLLTNMASDPSLGQSAYAMERRERERAREGKSSDTSWRLDPRRLDANAPGPLLDKQGKILRPFHILPGGSTSANALPTDEMNARQRLRDEVFRPSHRLPTMSIDDFLAEEERRGNVIRGGGHEGAAKATPRESRALRAEQDGTLEAEEAEEQARKEAVEWDAFKEANPKGIGNTMNRG